MPVFKQQMILDIARGIRVFLNLEAGITRAGTLPGLQQTQGLERVPDQNELEQAHRELANKDRELAELRARLGMNGGETAVVGINPENIVWMFGDGRSGSTWLMRMIEELEGQTLWREPMVGLLFGYLYYIWADEKRYGTKHFIMGRYKESWLRSIRNFILDGARTVFPTFPQNEYLVVKEPNGSIGAPLIMEALPESRMILLVRDPRDVVASSMDAHRKGSWHYERRNLQRSLADDQPEVFVESRANKYLWYVGNGKQAYEAHKGPKVLVKYEDLRSNTLGTMKRIYSELGISVDEGELSRAVQKHAWESIPEEEKGEGKFHRKAAPGGWRDDLTPEQARTVERITAPLLKEFYPYGGQSENLPEESTLSLQEKRMLFYA